MSYIYVNRVLAQATIKMIYYCGLQGEETQMIKRKGISQKSGETKAKDIFLLRSTILLAQSLV